MAKIRITKKMKKYLDEYDYYGQPISVADLQKKVIELFVKRPTKREPDGGKSAKN